MAEGINTTLVNTALVCAISVFALYIITKINQKPKREPEVHPVQGRTRRARWEPTSHSSSSSSESASKPPASSSSASSSSSSQVDSYQREWEARRSWVRNGADLGGIPGFKR